MNDESTQKNNDIWLYDIKIPVTVIETFNYITNSGHIVIYKPTILARPY